MKITPTLRWLILLCLLALTPPPLYAQHPDLKFDHAFELGANTEQAFVQDKDDFLWIGSWGGGLFRYDGYDLKNYGTGPALLGSAGSTGLTVFMSIN